MKDFQDGIDRYAKRSQGGINKEVIIHAKQQEAIGRYLLDYPAGSELEVLGVILQITAFIPASHCALTYLFEAVYYNQVTGLLVEGRFPVCLLPTKEVSQ